ncbi:hypothetical protein ACJJTC_005317 [Scirpophaga incertulas]
MSERLSRLDQLSRASNLEIQCVPESNSENVIKLVEQLGRTVKSAHGCVIPYSHPLSNTNQTHNQKKLQSCDLGIGGKTSCPIYVVENLSPENKELHAAARKRGKELGYKFVWIRGGKIFMRKDESANYTFVKNTDTLTRLT